MNYPNDPIQSRFERDVHFRALVSILESTIHAHQFSPSELRDACLLAATRYEMRTNRKELRFSESEVAEFMRRTGRNEAGERAIEAREAPYLAAQLANIRPMERPMPIFDPGPSARDEDIDWLARSGGG